jgi:hypothetical protein
VFYGVSVPFMAVAKLMVLDRMCDFAVSKLHPLSKRLYFAGCFAVVTTIIVSIVSLCANISTAVFQAEIGDILYTGGSFNDTRVRTRLVQVQTVEAAHYSCEVIRLLINVVAFGLVGALCIRRVKASLQNSSTSNSAPVKKLMLQIVVTTAFVFSASVLRASYAVWNAAAIYGSNVAECNSRFICSACHNDWQHMIVYDLYAPEIFSMVDFVSYPLTMLVALWGMTSDKMYQSLRKRKDDVLVDGDSRSIRDLTSISR